MLTLGQAADYLGITASTLHYHCKRGNVVFENKPVKALRGRVCRVFRKRDLIALRKNHLRNG